jgi:small nuclear ribonucleoprotein (snRNP)-like protein
MEGGKCRLIFWRFTLTLISLDIPLRFTFHDKGGLVSASIDFSLDGRISNISWRWDSSSRWWLFCLRDAFRSSLLRDGIVVFLANHTSPLLLRLSSPTAHITTCNNQYCGMELSVAGMASFSARDWHQLYETTKRQIVNKRQNGSRMTEKESSTLTGSIQTLDAQLNIMSNNVMEYEIATSEIARRQTLLENLKKQMLFVLAPNSRVAGGFGQADGPSAGGVALNPLQTSDKGENVGVVLCCSEKGRVSSLFLRRFNSKTKRCDEIAR